MACFKGYIEIFDSIEFHSKGKWENETKVVKEEKREAKSTANIEDINFKLNLNEIELLNGLQNRPVTTRNNRSARLSRAVQMNRKQFNNVAGKEESKKSKCTATIDCLDHSVALDLIAFGGI